MIRRVALFLVLGTLLAIPSLSAAAPIAGVASVLLCHGEDLNYGFCQGLGPDEAKGSIRLFGSLSLNGGSYTGGFAFSFIARKGAGLNYRFDNAPIHAAGFGLPYDVFDVLPSVPAGPPINGSCSGTLLGGGGLVFRLSCYFETEDGLSGRRKLLVAAVDDGYNDLQEAFQSDDGPPCGCPSYTGVYTRDFLKR